MPRRRSNFSWLGLLILILAIYTWTITAGTFNMANSAIPRQYTPLLADGFRQGHTWCSTPVPAWITALPNPYDPQANRLFRDAYAHDLSLFNGRLYAYWGPVPALLIWILATLTRIPPLSFDDARLVLFFLTGLLIVSALLILRVRCRLFPTLSLWSPLLCIAVAGLAAPNLCMLARPSVYEVAIAGAQFFQISGILLAFIGVDEKPRLPLLTAAAISWALALGCRISLAPAIATVAVLTLWQCHSRRLPAAFCLGLPITLSIASLLYYNHIRFGSFTEFGSHYQLAGVDQHAMPSLLSWRNVPFNTLRYLLSPPFFESHFPFVLCLPFYPTLLQKLHLPPDYGMEALIGMAWCLPFLCYTLSASRIPQTPSADLTQWLCRSLAVAGIIGIFPSLMVPGSAMRYLADATPTLCILATIGFFNRLATRRRKETIVLGSILAAITITMSFLISIRGYNDHLEHYNPSLWNTLRAIHL